MHLPGFRLLVPALAACCALLSASSSAAPIPVDDLFKKPAVADAKLSPDGKSIALRIPENSRYGLAVMDAESGKFKEVAEFIDADASWFSRAGNQRLRYGISYLFDENTLWTGFVQDGSFVVDRDGKNDRETEPDRLQADCAPVVGVPLCRCHRYLRRQARPFACFGNRRGR